MIDLIIIAISTLLGYLLRFNFEWADVIRYDLPLGIAIQVGVSLLAIYVTGSYRGIVRYSGIQDSVRIIYMLGLSFVLSIFINLAAYYVTQNNIIPYSVVLISILSSFLFLINYRLLVKQMFTHYRERISKKIRVLVYGAGQTGIITRHVIDSTPRMKTFGFIEDDDNKVNKLVDGIKIYNASPESIQYLIQHYSINEIVITVKELSYERKNELVDVCIQNRVRVRAVPPVGKWVRGELSINQIREMKIEELLGRESIRIVNPSIEQDLFGKRVLITGAAGSIGSELVRQVLTYHPEQMILVDQAESPLYELEREVRAHSRLRIIPYVADITNEDRMARIFEEHKPTHVYHAAAYKHVPLMEGNPSEAVMTNILGTKCVADLAVRFGVKKFVMISTDKAVNPTNVMGCSKRIAEIYVQALNNHLRAGTSRHTEFVTTRFGNVLGSNGSVIPIFKKQIEEGGPVTVTHPEITRFFMTIPEACQLVLEAGTMSNGGEIFIFDMGQSVRILDLARKMIRLSGREPDRDIEIVFTGLREGEKLYEELLNNSENTLPTHHNKILIAQVREYEYNEVNKFVDLFHDLVHDANELKMVALMKEIVPEYKSNYSRYEVLDNR